MIHPLVRDLYKRALLVGRDYPLGLEYVRKTWKQAICNVDNTPACYTTCFVEFTPECEKQIRKAVGKGRFFVREMMGVIQLKKYRAMKKRYDDDTDGNSSMAASQAIFQDYLKQARQQAKQQQHSLNGSHTTDVQGDNTSTAMPKR